MAFRLSQALLLDEPLEVKSPLASIFEEEPVSLDVFIQDKKFLGQTNIQLSPEQSNAVRHIERVYYPELYPQMAVEFDNPYWAEPIRMTNLITLQWGKGSGKDAIARWASLRIAYLLLCLKSPQEYFQMPESDSIHLLNIAANSGQANGAFFKPMTEAVRRSGGWFNDKAIVKQGHIQYAKNVEAVSGHSDAEGQEGLNLILGVADEIDAFRAQDEMVGLGKRAREASTSAESILKMLKGSASTRFPRTYKRVTISYPRYQGSTIQRQTDIGRLSLEKFGEKSIHFVSGPLATWDVNPRISGPEAFAEDYATDPIEAAAMYECKPARSSDAYFRNIQKFHESVDREEQPISVEYELVEELSPHTNKVVQNWKPVFNFASDFQPIQGAQYALHGDLAVRGDRAGIAMSHVESWKQVTNIVRDESGFEMEQSGSYPVVRTDFVFAFEAKLNATPAREIQIRWARELCFELIKRGFYIVSFTFDGFQSVDTIQTLESFGIPSERLSIDKDDAAWKVVKDVVYDQRLHMPKNPLLITEIEALSRVGNKVDHPPGGSKDLADAFAGSVVGAIVAGGEEDAEGNVVSIGDKVFDTGPSMVGLEGFDFTENEIMPLGFPGGMRGLGLYG